MRARVRVLKIERDFLDDGPLRRDLYAKHVDFFAARATYKERLFMAAESRHRGWPPQ